MDNPLLLRRSCKRTYKCHLNHFTHASVVGSRLDDWGHVYVVALQGSAPIQSLSVQNENDFASVDLDFFDEPIE